MTREEALKAALIYAVQAGTDSGICRMERLGGAYVVTENDGIPVVFRYCEEKQNEQN